MVVGAIMLNNFMQNLPLLMANGQGEIEMEWVCIV